MPNSRFCEAAASKKKASEGQKCWSSGKSADLQLQQFELQSYCYCLTIVIIITQKGCRVDAGRGGGLAVRSRAFNSNSSSSNPTAYQNCFINCDNWTKLNGKFLEGLTLSPCQRGCPQTPTRRRTWWRSWLARATVSRRRRTRPLSSRSRLDPWCRCEAWCRSPGRRQRGKTRTWSRWTVQVSYDLT